jgi:hypothetical protein
VGLINKGKIMKASNRKQLIGIVLILTLSLYSQGLLAKSFFWKATSDTTVVYLLGSIHMGVPSMYPLPGVITDAFNRSKYIVVEVNESAADPQEVQQKMQLMGMYTGTDTIADHVDQKTYQQLKTFLNQSQLPTQLFTKMKPGLIAITLSVLRLQQLGYSPDLGVDRHFLTLANKQSKPILELETMDQQLNLLLNFSDDALLLKHTMTQLADMETLTADMTRAWQLGDAARLEKLMITDQIKENPEYKPLMDRLIFRRNITMAEKIKAYLRSTKSYFVVVGAGHLVGDKGIVTLLKKAGYKTQQQ